MINIQLVKLFLELSLSYNNEKLKTNAWIKLMANR
jgi:hypothetical protein